MTQIRPMEISVIFPLITSISRSILLQLRNYHPDGNLTESVSNVIVFRNFHRPTPGVLRIGTCKIANHLKHLDAQYRAGTPVPNGCDLYPRFGCIVAWACNFDPVATNCFQHERESTVALIMVNSSLFLRRASIFKLTFL